MFEKIPLLLNNFCKQTHYYCDPYPHILINNAISYEDVLFLRAQEKILANKKKVSAKWNNIFFPDYRTDYLLPPNNFYNMFHLLCEIFGLQEFKCANLIYGRQVKGYPQSPDIIVNSYLSVYDQEQIAGPGIVSKINSLAPHRDRDNKMLIFLLYLGEKDDNLGGDLILYKSKSNSLIVDHKNIEPVKTIPYAPGTLVIFPNEQNAIHAIGDRQKGPYTRMMVCTLFECYDSRWYRRIRNTSNVR